MLHIIMEHKDKHVTSDTIAEQWVRLLLTHIEAKKVRIQDNQKHNKEAHEERQ